MLNTRCRWVVSGALVLGLGLGTGFLSSGYAASGTAEDGPPALEGPVSGGPGDLLPNASQGEVVAPAPAPTRAGTGLIHDAFRAAGDPGVAVRAPKAPPAPIAERPSDDRPAAQAQWVPGYWAWDASRGDFTWVAGAWRVPPRGMIWVDGRWQRDARGWARTPGFWSPRRAARRDQPIDPTVARAGRVVTEAGAAADWRTTGPPTQAPVDEPGQAPAPDAFYVPGHYTPDGDRVVWTRGFWARPQPGWDWVPARWVRRPDGWEYREGYWSRDPSAALPDNGAPAPLADRPKAGADVPPRAASGDPSSLPPAIVDSEPLGAGEAPAPGTGQRGEPPAATNSVPGRDPLAEAEASAPVPLTPGPVPYMVPAPGPYPMVRRPYVLVPRGYGPRYYDPLGVIPPFARRIIDRFTP